MLDRELNHTVGTILGSKNPEIHHYHQRSHPGAKWYIKTILPNINIIAEDAYPILLEWQKIIKKNKNLICITDIAYDWSGDRIPNWSTIWLNNRIDVIWNFEDNAINWQVVDVDVGFKTSATTAMQWVKTNLSSRQSHPSAIDFDNLCEIANFLKTYTSEKHSKNLRAQLRVIDSNEIFIETISRE